MATHGVLKFLRRTGRRSGSRGGYFAAATLSRRRVAVPLFELHRRCSLSRGLAEPETRYHVSPLVGRLRVDPLTLRRGWLCSGGLWVSV